MVMSWKGKEIANLSRAFLDTNGAVKHTGVSVAPKDLSPLSKPLYKNMAEMAADRFAVAPDTPGFGASDPPQAPVDVPTLARSVLAVADHFELDEFDVLGYHTGSKIAVELALQLPTRVRTVTLVSAPVYMASELEAQRAWLASPRTPVADGSHLVEQFVELVRWLPEGTPLALAQREFAEQQRGGDAAHWGYLAAFSYDHAQALPRVQQPVLLLCPSDDLETPTLRAEPLVGRGRFLRLEGWGHQMMVTRTAEVAALLRAHSRQG